MRRLSQRPSLCCSGDWRRRATPADRSTACSLIIRLSQRPERCVTRVDGVIQPLSCSLILILARRVQERLQTHGRLEEKEEIACNLRMQ
jgi:hypothetical protein